MFINYIYVYMYMHIYLQISTNIYSHICMCVYISIDIAHMYIHICVYIYIYIYTQINIVYIWRVVYLRVCVYVCMVYHTHIKSNYNSIPTYMYIYIIHICMPNLCAYIYIYHIRIYIYTVHTQSATYRRPYSLNEPTFYIHSLPDSTLAALSAPSVTITRSCRKSCLYYVTTLPTSFCFQCRLRVESIHNTFYISNTLRANSLEAGRHGSRSQ